MIKKILFILSLLFLITLSSATVPSLNNTYADAYSTEAYIHWTSNISSSNIVQYSVNSDLAGSINSSWKNSTTTPHILLSGLTRDTVYYYKVHSYHGVDHANTSILSFTTKLNTYGFSKHFDDLFKVNELSGWGVAESLFGVGEEEVGASIFWILILSMPFLGTLLMQKSMIIPSMFGLIGAAILMPMLPPEFDLPIKILLSLSIAGFLWHLFISRRN